MNLTQLRYFLTVADTGSMNAAAEILRIAQPAISRQIRNLEADLSVRLFDRHDRGVSLTRQGEDYARQLRPLIAKLDQLHHDIRRDNGAAKRLRVGLNQFGQWHDIVVTALDRFRARHPDIVIEGEMTLSRNQVEAIEADMLDVAIGAPLRGLPAGFNHIALFMMPLGVLMDERHPLAGADRISLKTIAAYPLVSYSYRTWPTIMDQVDALMGSASGVHVAEMFDDASLLLARPRDGRTIAIVPEPGVHAQTSGLVFRRIDDLAFDVPIELFWRHAEPGSAAERFIAEVRELVAA